MVARGWGAAAATAVGAAAAASAAQLGLGYGLDIISWPAAGTGTSDTWVASLTWAAWIAATSTIAGAVMADRLAGGGVMAGPATGDAQPRPGHPGASGPGAGRHRAPVRLLLAVAAAIGAAATAVLVAVPARVTELAGTPSPQTEAGGYALLGVAVGLVLALGALAARAVAANLLATAGWLWVLAISGVVEGVLAGRDWVRVPLGFWELGVTGPWFRNLLLPDAGVALGAALLVGVLAAWPAARRGDHLAGVVASGGAGPLVIAAAYLLTQPDLSTVSALEVSRVLVVPYLVLAGLVGSLLVAATPGRGARASGAPSPAVTGARTAGEGGDQGATAGDGATPASGAPSPRGGEDELSAAERS